MVCHKRWCCFWAMVDLFIVHRASSNAAQHTTHTNVAMSNVAWGLHFLSSYVEIDNICDSRKNELKSPQENSMATSSKIVTFIIIKFMYHTFMSFCQPSNRRNTKDKHSTMPLWHCAAFLFLCVVVVVTTLKRPQASGLSTGCLVSSTAILWH